MPGPHCYRIRAPDAAWVEARWHNQAMHQRVLTGTLVRGWSVRNLSGGAGEWQ